MLKKIKTIFLALTITLIACFPISADVVETRAPIYPETVNVNKTFNAKLSCAGCFGYATFNIKGSYTYHPSSNSVSNINLRTSMLDHTSDWQVYLDGASYEPFGNQVKVIVRYHFVISKLDCPQVAPQYNATVIYV